MVFVIERKKVEIEQDLQVEGNKITIHIDFDWWTAIWIGIKGIGCAFYDIPGWCQEKMLQWMGGQKVDDKEGE